MEDSFDERIKIASSSDSDDSDSDKGKGGGDSSSDVSSFDGEIIIEKSKKSLLNLPASGKANGKEKPKKEKGSDKLDKSKAIKKEKKVKKKNKAK